jgi:hypothetical protein
MEFNDLTRMSDHLPFGDPLAEGDSDALALPPFGLRFASTPRAAAMVDLDRSKIGSDRARQIATVTDDDGTVLRSMNVGGVRTYGSGLVQSGWKRSQAPTSVGQPCSASGT